MTTRYFNQNFENFNELTRSEKFKLINYGGVCVKSHTDNALNYFIIDHVTCKRSGKNIYLKRTPMFSLYDNREKIKVRTSFNFLDRNCLQYLFNEMGITWMNKDFDYFLENYHYYLKQPGIIKALYQKKIYSEETLLKKILSNSYHTKEINWKTFRNYLRLHDCFISLCDILAYTKNPEQSLQAYIKNYNKNKTRLLRDLLTSAIELNEKVDFTWSEKRLNKEHSKQITELNKREIENKDTGPLNDIIVCNKDWYQPNTELELFNVGLKFHNCVYNCYYQAVKEHKYIVLVYKNKYCIGINKDKQSYLDQVYKAYNEPLSNDERELVFAELNKQFPWLKIDIWK